MSAKWRRSLAWDDAHFPNWAAPAKFVLRAFSSIALAVVLLILVALYGLLASVPIGMLALIPTWVVYVGVAAGCAFVLAACGVFFVRRFTSKGALRFTLSLLLGLVGAAVGAWFFSDSIWPGLRYDPVPETGIRFFPAFVEAYQETTLRRLPGLEMTELEFYSWWPLQLILMLFVVNMVTATVRRIEFTFKNLGVLTVHTGIVVIALGSVYYQGLKREGDMLLLSGAPLADGSPGLGRPERIYYDNIQTSLFVYQHRGWQQRRLSGVPRYNDYNLGVTAGLTASEVAGFEPAWLNGPDRTLSVEIPAPKDEAARALIDPDIEFRIIGYAQYAESVDDWVQLDPSEDPLSAQRGDLIPLNIVQLTSRLPDDDGNVEDARAFAFTLAPTEPTGRYSDNGFISVEYLPIGTSPERIRDLSEQIPGGAPHGLVIEVPGAGLRRVVPAQIGRAITLGDTGYTITVQQLLPEPPFPIVTEGYEGANSSVAVVRVSRTVPETGEAETYERYIYSRFPAIDQDIIVGGTRADGRPNRRDPEPGLKLTYLDATRVGAQFIDTPTGDTRVIVRGPGGAVRVVEGLPIEAAPWNGEPMPVLRDFVPNLDLWIADKWRHAQRFQRPVPVAELDRQGDFIGTHDKALLAVEVTARRSGSAEPMRRIVWVPFSKYMGLDPSLQRRVSFPDGRRVDLVFGRVQRPLPGFQLRLVDFEMIAYDNRGAPRDYQSTLIVEPAGQNPALEEPYRHVTKLNAPLTAPFHKDGADGAGPIGFIKKLFVGMNPDQFKFSQAGWDKAGWETTQAATDRGEMPRPIANFTILGVGNNPGIYVIALGGILMSVGIPWAFYVKPWLVRRESARLRAQHAKGAAEESASEPKPVVSPAVEEHSTAKEEAGAPA
ncbi:MAG: hypothetical protein AAGB51_07255 [Planctomycetota bacterium]